MARDITSRNVVFKGTSSGTLGIKVLRFPLFPVAESKGEYVDIPGRDGGVFLDGEGFSSVEAEGEFLIPSSVSMDNVRKWLSGAGDMILSCDATKKRRAWVRRVREDAEYAQGMRRVTAQFGADPFRYLVQETGIILGINTTVFSGFGDVASLPVIRVTAGSAGGDIGVTLNGTEILLRSLSAGDIVTIDCAARMAIKDGSAFSLSLTDDAWPQCQTGTNTASFTGTPAQVLISPNWRWL